MQQVGDEVVADAECARLDQAAEPDDDAAEGRPPHRVDRQALEQFFDLVEQRRQQAGLQTDRNAERRAGEIAPPWQHRRPKQRKQRGRAERQRAPSDRDDGGHGYGNEASWLPFEEQKFDGEEHRGDRRPEDRRHPRRGTGDEQRLAFGRAEVEELREQGTESAPGHDDGPFGPERAAGADRDGGGDRLQDRHFRGDAAVTDQGRLDRFGNAVAANRLAAVAGHQADDETAQRWGRDHPPCAWRSGHRREGSADPTEPDEIGHERDELDEAPCGQRSDGPDDERHRGKVQRA